MAEAYGWTQGHLDATEARRVPFFLELAAEQKARRLLDTALAFIGGKELQARLQELIPVHELNREEDELEAVAKAAESLGQHGKAKEARDRIEYLAFCKRHGIQA